MDESDKKLKHVAKLVKQFRSNIKYKPFNDSVDQARTTGFINSLSDVLMSTGRNLPKLKQEPKMFDVAELTEDEKEKNRDLSAEWLKKIRNENGNRKNGTST
tara:strand:+ start:265 stop:570 length:306 start_codon:yes stop_codon:yes gene_type:complete